MALCRRSSVLQRDCTVPYFRSSVLQRDYTALYPRSSVLQRDYTALYPRSSVLQRDYTALYPRRLSSYLWVYYSLILYRGTYQCLDRRTTVLKETLNYLHHLAVLLQTALITHDLLEIARLLPSQELSDSENKIFGLWHVTSWISALRFCDNRGNNCLLLWTYCNDCS
jgi:hypothetical protein